MSSLWLCVPVFLCRAVPCPGTGSGEEDVGGVADVGEEEGVSRSRCPGPSAVLAFDDPSESLDGQFPPSDFKQGAHDGTYHVAQETVSLYGENPLGIARLLPAGVHDTAVVGLHVRVELAETGKVGVVEKGSGCFVHEGEVRLSAREAARVIPPKRRLACGDIVFIGAVGGVETRMGIVAYPDGPVDGDVRGEDAI